MKLILFLIVFLFVSNCSTNCKSDNYCEKKINWNDPKFSLFRTIITNGTNLGK